MIVEYIDDPNEEFRHRVRSAPVAGLLGLVEHLLRRPATGHRGTIGSGRRAESVDHTRVHGANYIDSTVVRMAPPSLLSVERSVRNRSYSGVESSVSAADPLPGARRVAGVGLYLTPVRTPAHRLR